MSVREHLLRRLADRSALIGVIGLGYVGIPLALAFSDAGFRILGFDVDPDRVAMLNAGQSPIRHIDHSRIGDLLARDFTATCDYTRTGEPDVLVICVPTPLDAYREPDLSFVIATIEGAAPHMRPGQLVSLESTTWPGTTEEVLQPRLEAHGLEVGTDVFVVYSPEREDPGNGRFTTRTIPKLVGGLTPICREVGAAAYRAVVDNVVEVTSTKVAEMAKLLENIHRAVNIGLVNEMKIVADRMNVDIFEVINAAATKPFGFTAYYPGPGIGGHCIPVDPFYLTWKAREYGLHTRFIELAGEINAAMPRYVTDKLIKALNEHGKALSRSRILVLGLAYKRGIDDMRESPSIEIMHMLRDLGATLRYSDPFIPVFPKLRRHSFDLASVPVTPAEIAAADAVMILTDHDQFDYDLLLREASLIIDTRGRFHGRGAPNVISA